MTNAPCPEQLMNLGGGVRNAAISTHVQLKTAKDSGTSDGHAHRVHLAPPRVVTCSREKLDLINLNDMIMNNHI
jgi:hypothetical protein